MAASPVMDFPVIWLVPPLGRSNFFFSPKSRRRALGSSLFNKSLSCMAVEEEVCECIRVTSKPIRLRGHLHVLSDVECSTRKARSNGRCLGRSRMTFVGSISTWFWCLMRWTMGRILLKMAAKESRRSSLVVFFWLVVHPRQWSPNGSNFAEQEQWVRLVLGHSGRRSLRLTMTSKMLLGNLCLYWDLLMVNNAIETRLSRIASRRFCSWSCGSCSMCRSKSWRR